MSADSNRTATASCAEHKFAVYFGARMQGFWPKRLSLSLGDETVVERHYSVREARALTDKGLDRLACLEQPPEPETLTASFSGSYIDATDRAPERGAEIEYKLHGNRGAHALILTAELPWWPLARPRFGAPRWWQPVSREEQGAAKLQDPRIGHVHFLRALDEIPQAVVELQDLIATVSSNGASYQHAHRLLFTAYLEQGLPLHAHRVYRAHGFGNAWNDADQQTLLQLAEHLYRLDHHAEVYKLLQVLDTSAESERMLRQLDLQLRNLIALGLYEEAVELVALRDRTWDFTPYMRFNMGVAFLQAGKTEKGLAILERVGLLNTEDRAELALRDRANLYLGQHFLRSGHGATAKHYLQQIRLDGPYANKALLWWGRSELTQPGAPVRRQLLGRELHDRPPSDAPMSPRFRLEMGFFPYPEETEQNDPTPYRYFNRADVKTEERAGVANAAGAWSLLIGRDQMDDAIIEGYLDLAQHLALLGNKARAQSVYRSAIDHIDELAQRQQSALDEIQSRSFQRTLDEAIEAGSPLALPGAEWLGDIFANHLFHQAWSEYGRLRTLPEDSVSPREQLLHDEQFLRVWKKALAAQGDFLQRHMREALENRLGATVRYKATARFALARLHDRAPRALAR